VGLPKAEQQAPEWQAATEVLILIAEHDGDPMMARIVMMKALQRVKPPSMALHDSQRAPSVRWGG
jgi:hypothetical protein